MSDADHTALLDTLLAAAAMVVLSGYDTPLYRDRLAAWERVEVHAYADGARPRLEVIWSNPAAVAARGALFAPRPAA